MSDKDEKPTEIKSHIIKASQIKNNVVNNSSNKTNSAKTEEKKATVTKKHKKKKNFRVLYLFAIVFISALAGISYIVKLYSPDIDVTIGNTEALTLSDSDMDSEMKPIDERLKWIQMEDDLPTVALRNQEKQTNIIKYDNEDEDVIVRPKKEETKKKPPVPSIKDVKIPEVKPTKIAASPTLEIKQPVIPPPKPIPIVTKVYLGSYSSLEEAMEVQRKIASDEPSVSPFIKAVRNQYVVQLGSFSDKEKATSFVQHLKSKGYSPKMNLD